MKNDWETQQFPQQVNTEHSGQSYRNTFTIHTNPVSKK